ncbi:MAG TPA: VWA domain-containing protein [Terracidiphilus sp.]|nr:VWA domain-containing protein [Terracidiphilus sp.]
MSNQPTAASQAAAGSAGQAHPVILLVTVRDKHGSPVNSLNASDLALTQDGRPQKIASLARQSDLPFKLGLLVDTSRALSGAMDAERKAAAKFVDTMLPEKPAANPDKAFLIHFDREVELLEDFTPSRDALHKELDDMGPTSASRDDKNGPETNDDERERPSGRQGTQLYDAIYLASSEVIKPDDSGRNVLVVFSDGVDRGSKDTLNDAIDAADKSNIEIYTVYFRGEQERNTGYPGGHHGGVSFPGGGGGYPGGGYPGGGGRRDERPSADGRKTMEQIATRTGGLYYEAKSTPHLDEIYSQIAEQLHGQYVLTYTPDQPDNEGGYHKVALTANNKDLSVATRQGYYAPGGDSGSSK